MGPNLSKVAKDDANVSKLVCPALRFVNVVSIASERIKLTDFYKIRCVQDEPPFL